MFSPKKDSLSEAIVGAVSAIAAHAANTPPSSMPSAPSTPTSTPITSALSPNNQANLGRNYLEDLRTLSQLFNNGVLSDSEFQEQKDVLLNGLRKLK